MSLNFNAANSNIVRNYFIDDRINGRQDPNLDVWDGFFDLGDPNIQSQQVQINYEIPLYKIPTFNFLRATYSYTGDFQWQKGSDLNTNLPITEKDGSVTTYNLGNSIQNANTHILNSTLNMENLYKYVGLVKKPTRANSAVRRRAPGPTSLDDNGNPVANNQPQGDKSNGAGTKALNSAIDLLTMVKRIQVNYTENNGTFLPGYLRTPGFIGTLKPTFGYTFGSQSDIRDMVARNGWLTVYPDFNQQYTEVSNRILEISANLEILKDLKIDLSGSRAYSENFSENFNTIDTNGDGFSNAYNSLITNSFGNFNISTVLIKTAFSKSDEIQSTVFNDFRANRLTVANRLATDYYGTSSFPTDAKAILLVSEKIIRQCYYLHFYRHILVKMQTM